MSSKKTGVKKIAVMALFASAGLMLQYIESVAFSFGLPGERIGLANIVSVINIFVLGGANALAVSVLRAFVGSLLTQGAASVVYSVAGALCSGAVMWALKERFYPKLSEVGISVAGAAVHNFTQLLVGSFFFSAYLIYSFLPMMLICGVLGGIITGCAARAVLKVLRQKENGSYGFK